MHLISLYIHLIFISQVKFTCKRTKLPFIIQISPIPNPNLILLRGYIERQMSNSVLNKMKI